jgi:hypothetical protein
MNELTTDVAPAARQPKKRWVALVVVLVVVSVGAAVLLIRVPNYAKVRNAFPPPSQDVLMHADRFTLYTICSPAPVNASQAAPWAPRTILADDFNNRFVSPQYPNQSQYRQYHGYLVLSQVDVTSRAIQRQLVNALFDGVAHGSDPGSNACFDPTYAIQAAAGGHEVDVLASFSCAMVQVSIDGTDVGGGPTSAAPQAVFDQVASQARI